MVVDVVVVAVGADAVAAVPVGTGAVGLVTVAPPGVAAVEATPVLPGSDPVTANDNNITVSAGTTTLHYYRSPLQHQPQGFHLLRHCHPTLEEMVLKINEERLRYTSSFKGYNSPNR